MQSFNELEEIELPGRIKGDELRLKQVLVNLVKNAFKFTQLGYIRILAGYDTLNGYLKVQVCDTGVGIAP